ncbi:MAG: MFS transporter, partial [Spiribacter sp.]|nr:MFS transporter [Spiribacter sp.]
MAVATPRERINVAILASGQALFLMTAVTVMTLSGMVGQQLSPNPVLATLPVALMQVGTLTATFPASLLMKRIGRRAGFMIGAGGGGVAGAGLAAYGIAEGSFVLFNLGNLLLGIYQAFAMYYRFAAADC